jgi:hypothetical protein
MSIEIQSWLIFFAFGSYAAWAFGLLLLSQGLAYFDLVRQGYMAAFRVPSPHRPCCRLASLVFPMLLVRLDARDDCPCSCSPFADDDATMFAFANAQPPSQQPINPDQDKAPESNIQMGPAAAVRPPLSSVGDAQGGRALDVSAVAPRVRVSQPKPTLPASVRPARPPRSNDALARPAPHLLAPSEASHQVQRRTERSVAAQAPASSPNQPQVSVVIQPQRAARLSIDVTDVTSSSPLHSLDNTNSRSTNSSQGREASPTPRVPHNSPSRLDSSISRISNAPNSNRGIPNSASPASESAALDAVGDHNSHNPNLGDANEISQHHPSAPPQHIDDTPRGL